MDLTAARDPRVAMPDPGRPRLLPPIVAAMLLAASAVLDFALPSMPRWRLPVAGAVLLVAGLGTMLWAARLFGHAGTTLIPYGRPTQLVLAGPYRFTRNPMYLGITTALVGIALLVGTPPFFVSAVIFPLWMNARFIPMEERNLQAALGEDYRAYCARVRRWL